MKKRKGNLYRKKNATRKEILLKSKLVSKKRSQSKRRCGKKVNKKNGMKDKRRINICGKTEKYERIKERKELKKYENEYWLNNKRFFKK